MKKGSLNRVIINLTKLLSCLISETLRGFMTFFVGNNCYSSNKHEKFIRERRRPEFVTSLSIDHSNNYVKSMY